LFSLPERELGLDEVVSWTIKLYTSRFPLLYVPFLVASLPLMALEVLVLNPLLTNLNSYISNQYNVAYVNPIPFDSTMIAIGLVLGIIYFLLEIFVNGYAIVTTSALVKGGKTDAMSLLNEAYKKYWSYLAATILLGVGLVIVVLAPFSLLFLPGGSGVAVAILLFIAFSSEYFI
jgi:hypothetical protein